MFSHIKKLQYTAKPTRPDPVYVKKTQEIPGDEYGEISVYPGSTIRKIDRI